ncbi:MAG: helix-turn-helix domain-containing protein [Steroidobacteraceae bacterium]
MSVKVEIPALPPLDVNRRYGVNPTLQYLNTSRATFYAMLKAGRIKTITEGKRRYIPGAEIARLSAVPSNTEAA